jgi:DnaJ-class molecular chaperone
VEITYGSVCSGIDAALKPAEAGADSCEFCKGWGFRANPDGADEGCGACNGTGKEPSDDQP